MTSLILVVDLGTSALKVALMTPAGDLVASDREELSLCLLPGGGAEQDPAEWWEKTGRACSRMMAAAAAAPESVIAVSCTAQWSGTVAVDENGAPLRPAILWMDSRGAPYARRIVSGPVRVRGYGVGKLVRWTRRCGGIPTRAGKDPIAHILWLKNREPQTYQRAHLFLEPKDWLNLRLTGRAAASYDSIVLHWLTNNRRPEAIDYDPVLLRLAGVDRAQFPELVPATSILGPLSATAAAALGVAAGCPVVAGTPDYHATGIGAGATGDFQPHLYVGTSSWLTCQVPFKKTDLRRNIASLPSPIPGRYFIGDEQETAGGALRFLRDTVAGPGGASLAGYAELDAMAARAPPGSGRVIFTPWLYGERTPVEDRFVRAGFHNLSLTTTREELVRAVFEGVALNTRWLMGAVERFAGRRLEPVRFIGGGARSDVWCQIFADVLGRVIEQVDDPVNAGVRGAGLLAAVALGELTLEEIPGRVKVVRSYQPCPGAHGLYGELFTEFVGLYRRNRRAYARLNARFSG